MCSLLSSIERAQHCFFANRNKAGSSNEGRQAHTARHSNHTQEATTQVLKKLLIGHAACARTRVRRLDIVEYLCRAHRCNCPVLLETKICHTLTPLIHYLFGTLELWLIVCGERLQSVIDLAVRHDISFRIEKGCPS